MYNVLNLFYQEPEIDRWFKYDRYPRRVIRRMVRGPARVGGHKRVFVNLVSGLARLGKAYRVNDFGAADRDPASLVCIVGKPCVLDKVDWRNDILFGSSGYSHPVEDPELFSRLPVRKVLVPGAWMADMCRPYWGDRVEAWPVGIDTGRWVPDARVGKSADVLVYDKIMWDRDEKEQTLVGPIARILDAAGHSVEWMRYGSYREEDYRAALARARAMIFLCEHETQGIAYQQALSMGVPILAWDRGGPWQDPAFYPHKVVFGPVSSVPYWDERCGEKFVDAAEFEVVWGRFWDNVCGGRYAPRDYMLENLTLERCALEYVRIVDEVSGA